MRLIEYSPNIPDCLETRLPTAQNGNPEMPLGFLARLKFVLSEPQKTASMWDYEVCFGPNQQAKAPVRP